MSAVSVIIPVYNTEKYLRRCLDSICNQTLKDIEIICVNDASPDNSAAILAEYAARDPRVKVITFRENRGVGAVRNAGIDVASGDYLGFVDSDDFVDCDFYEKLLEPHRALVLGNLVEERYDEYGAAMETLNAPYYQKVRHDALRFKVGFFGIFYVALYRKSLIVENGIRFAEGRIIGEDRLFPVLANYYAETVAVNNDTYYHYRHREGSATKRAVDDRIVSGVVGFVGDVADFLRRRQLSVQDARFLIHQTFVDALYGPAYRTDYVDALADAAEAFYQEFEARCDYKPETVAAVLAAMRRGRGLDGLVGRLELDVARANAIRKIHGEKNG